jgi:hypothetical protein
MGQRIITFDDLDGSHDDTVAKREFSAGRNGWEIDLSDENWAELLDALAPYIAKAKKVRGPGIKASGPRVGPSTSVPAADNDADDQVPLLHPGTKKVQFADPGEPARLARWAERNHVVLSRPGRPPQSILLAFRADDVNAVPDQYRLASA